jgi:hemerythrin-like domain-containing protein
MDAAMRADHVNQRALFEWADFLHNYAPSGCHGSEEKLLAWYAAHHPKPASATQDDER